MRGFVGSSVRSIGALALAFCLSQGGTARAYSPVPEYPGVGGVATGDTNVDASVLRMMLAQHTSRIGASYSVAFVTFTDRDDRPGPDFGDTDQVFIESLVTRWGPYADPQSSIFIVISTSNRDIIVHPSSRYSRLGWEGEAVKSTIDASDFGVYARAGDYAQAVLALVLAIETEVAGREAQRRTERALMQAAVADARTSVARFEHDAEHASVSVGAGRLRAAELLERVRAQEARLADPSGSIDRRALEDVEGRTRSLDHYFDDAAMKLDEIRTFVRRLEARRARIARHPRLAGSDPARRRLRELDASIAILRRGLDARDPSAAWDERQRADDVASLAQSELESAQVRFTFVRVVLPTVIAAALVLLALRAARDRRRIVGTLLEQARARLDELDAALGHAGEKLLALENEHALFLAGGTAPTQFVGASEAPIREAAASVDALFLAFEAATRIASEARARLAATTPFDLGAAQRALAALATEPFVTRTEQVVSRKLLLPDEREIRETVPTLLQTLEAAFARASRELEALGLRIGAVHERIDDAGESFAEAAKAVEEASARASLGRADQLVAELEASRRALVETSRLDPIGAEALVQAFETELASFRDTATAAERTSRWVATELPATRASLVARIASRRQAGVRLREPDFDPDARLDDVARIGREVSASLARGDFEDALAKAQAARRALDAIDAAIDAVELVRSEYAARITFQRHRVVTLRARVAERAEKVVALRQAYTPESLGEVADYVARSTETLDRVAADLVEATRLSSEAEQGYLGAKRLVDRATNALEDVEALFVAIDRTADDLEGDRNETALDLSLVSRWLGEIDADVAAIAVAGGRAIATTPGLREEAAAIEARLAARPLPMGEIARAMDALAARTREEVERVAALRLAFASRAKSLVSLDESVRALGGMLEASSDDRSSVNERYAAARDRYRAFAAAAPGPDEIAASVDEARALDAELAELWALGQADIQQGPLARTALAEAHAALRVAEAALPFTRILELSRPRAQLREAQDALSAQDYLQAKRLAQHALEAIQASTEAETWRRQNAAAEAARRFENDLDRKIAWQDRLERDRSAGRSRSSSSSSWGSSPSWGSSGSSHSHRSSSSSSSSSRSSSSGRSSYGSSSGSSKTGSSSGRSKW